MNGIGEKMEDALQAELERFIDGEPAALPWATEGKIGKTIDFYSGRNRYIGLSHQPCGPSFEKHKVGLDCANGSSWMIGRAVFDALGAKTYVINDQPDGVNINMDCGSTHIEGLQLYVREHHLDVGFAFDGDADRCLAVDERGEVLNGDKIMYICAKFLKERGQLPGNTLVTTVMSNFGLYKALDKAGIRYEKTAVGDRYVYENMKENDYVLGGEQSGHIIFRKYAHTGDGLITALMLMEVMMETQLPLSVLASSVSMYPQVLKNVGWMIKTLRFRTAPCRRRWTNAPPHWGIPAGCCCARAARSRYSGSWRRLGLPRNVKSGWTISSPPWKRADISSR